MNLTSMSDKVLGKLPGGVAGAVYRGASLIPGLRRRLDKEYESMLASVPGVEVGADVPVYTKLPNEPRSRDEILADIGAISAVEEAGWSEGRASGAVYHGDSGHIGFLNEVYALQSQSNPLHLDLWPSGMKFEAEVVAMTADILGAAETPDEIVGNVTSGGTESIILAMKAYRDRAGQAEPEMVLPDSAHVAFDKAAQYLGYRQVRVPVGADYDADVEAMTQAISKRTVVVVGSAPGFPHGIVDPIPELSEMARERGIGFHTDACLGGFVMPWVAQLGYDAPQFDFRLPGVTSMSADTHKYGYAAKGTSVVLYRGRALRHHQYYVATEWPGGLYFSPTIAGSRPGALLASAWAAMLSMGEAGYERAAAAILATGAEIRDGVNAIAELRVLGDPLWVVAFASEEVNIYEVMARMAERGWSLNGLHHPEAVHLAVTLRHTQDGVAATFLEDLRSAVETAKATGLEPHTGSAPMYGMAATFPARGAVAELLRRYVDRLYQVTPKD